MAKAKKLVGFFRQYSGRLTVLVLLLGGALFGAGGSANAAARPISPEASSVTCDSWIENTYGKASCWGNLYGGYARIKVVCSAWWDPDVTGDWVYIPPGKRAGSADGLIGHCISPVESVTTETK